MTTTSELPGLLRYLTKRERGEIDRLVDDRAMQEADVDLSLADYIRAAWQVVEPNTAFVPGWHIDAIAEHLEAVSSGQIRRLIINVPPGAMKSLSCCVFWPTWEWTKRPSRRFLTASYSSALSIRDALKSRRIIQSAWYQERWGKVFSLNDDQNQKSRYENSKTGWRVASSIGGVVTGERADIRILDDPHKADEAYSDQIREGDIEWLSTTWSTRASDPQKSAEVLIMQRLHQHDATGYYLEEIGGFVHLMLPMRFESHRRCVTSIGFSDPRTRDGELLCERRFTEQSVKDLELRLRNHAAGQLQQRPTAAEGEIFKAQEWRFWYAGEEPTPWQVRNPDGEFVACKQAQLPESFTRMAQSWDMTYKDTKGTDFVVGQVWGQRGAEVFLLDQVRNHLDFPATCEALKGLCKRWPKTVAKWVEDAANGPAVIQSLRQQIPGLIALSPEGSKEARAHAIAPFQVAGNVYLPHPSQHPWVQLLLAELAEFPQSRYDDQVDALTQAVSQMLLHRTGVSDRVLSDNATYVDRQGVGATINRAEF